jgi:hypothetical protein
MLFGGGAKKKILLYPPKQLLLLWGGADKELTSLRETSNLYLSEDARAVREKNQINCWVLGLTPKTKFI